MNSRILIVVALAVATMAVYAPVGRFSFVNYDDPEYVTGNPHVRQGLSLGGVAWAFAHTHSANWHPLTSLSHMLDCELFGLNPHGHHLVNLALHTANTVLLFLFLAHTTGQVWPSTFVAALFALHPLHVESVAWIAERKDVLSTFFFLLALCGYAAYVSRPSAGRYTLVAVTFALGLMSKPMVVTLPFVLLLLDVWPFRRLALNPWSWAPPRGVAAGPAQLREASPSISWLLLVEKLPLFVLAGIASVITYLVQQGSGAVVSLDNLSLGFRLANAVVAYAWYVVKAVWPSNLAVFYPLASELPLTTIVPSALLLLALTAVAWRAAEQHPYVPVGWLWFLGTLVPVIGLIKAGEQSTADRFTYIPYVGLFIMAAWSGREVAIRGRMHQRAVMLGALAAIVAYTAVTRAQLQHWSDGPALFRHALAVTDGNYVAHTNLGQALAAQSQFNEALEHFREAVRLRPAWGRAHVNLAVGLAAAGDKDGALREYSEALRLDPDDPMAHLNRGLLVAEQGDYDEAIREYGRALALQPDYVKAYLSMGIALAALGRHDEAIDQYASALRLEPESATAHANIAIALEDAGRRAEAMPHYVAAARLAPNDARVHFNLAAALELEGRTDEARDEYRAAIRAQSNFGPAHLALGKLLAKAGDREGAIAEIRAALAAQPHWPEAEAALAALMPRAEEKPRMNTDAYGSRTAPGLATDEHR